MPDLQPLLQSLLESGRYSDLTISCEGRKFAVHRAIVCCQSSFFGAAVKGGFKAASSQIDLPDDELATIQRVVTFLYIRDYDDTGVPDIEDKKSVSGEDKGSHAVLLDNLGVFIAADKFDIAPLKQLARTRLINWIDENAQRLPFVVPEIWVTLPPLETELRDAIIKAISYHAQEFLNNDESIAILTDLPAIAIAVLKKKLMRIFFSNFNCRGCECEGGVDNDTVMYSVKFVCFHTEFDDIILRLIP
ncbi:unnamed protein product [Penicillium nalgiovense]|uniref:BTB domain-containing protein n=1 Tax=Penicillium nalgiovense TaxID=60175 RepID=A0A9W4MLS7_PENNA|nr:unnamed protein product [Penicillium nalgiovense]CAG7973539.1 unnamed protein product [Penicillium nalgiovense]CAG7978478.1 unnamed protein product [Penicillium nalgiovense]CAG7979584.1 unnamed protein product [Penicillium nalgiovense]CAG7982290.1 unnamed protein product [Penicillium nalgiovense]